MRYEFVSKPKKCPECGSTRVANILFGMPAFSKEIEEKIHEGKIVLGGCCISDDDPKWKCIDCSTEIYKKIELL